MRDIKISKHGQISKTCLADCVCLDRLAREEDRREVEDISGRSLGNNLAFACAHAQPCLTARTKKGELLGIFGVVPLGGRQGAIAFVGTKAIEENGHAFLRGSKDVMSYLEKNYPYDFLMNVVDARNEVHVHWLKWLGFNMIRQVDAYGSGKLKVIEFAKICKSP